MMTLRQATADDVGYRVLRRLEGVILPNPVAVVEAASWRDKIASACEWLAHRLRGNLGQRVGYGKYLSFTQTSSNLGYPVYTIRSVRGGMHMGTVEWSNQWRRARFKPSWDTVFDQQCIAEIYAAMKEVR